MDGSQEELTSQQRRKKRRAQIVGVALGVVVVAIIAGAAIIATAGNNSAPVTTADAVHNLIAKINSGPDWVTARISDGLAGYLKGRSTDKAVAGAVSCHSLLGRGNVGCGQCVYVNHRNPNDGFACFLQAAPSNGYKVSYFSESASGGDIHPISISQYGKLLGPSERDPS